MLAHGLFSRTSTLELSGLRADTGYGRQTWDVTFSLDMTDWESRCSIERRHDSLAVVQLPWGMIARETDSEDKY
jgi:hypothetical protein